MDILVAILLIAVLCWLVIRVGANLHAARTRTLDGARLDRKFSGLMRFGKPGAYLSLVKSGSADRFTFIKRSEDASAYLEVDISSSLLTSEVVHRIRSALSVLATSMRLQTRELVATEGHLRIRLDRMDEHDSAALEAVLRLVAHELHHSSGDRYQIEFEGPVNHDKVAEYYS